MQAYLHQAWLAYGTCPKVWHHISTMPSDDARTEDALATIDFSSMLAGLNFRFPFVLTGSELYKCNGTCPTCPTILLSEILADHQFPTG